MELISNYPWYYTLLCFLAGFIFSAGMYYREKHQAERPKALRYGLAALRFASVTLIALLLLDIFMKRLVNETEKPVVVFLQDNSSSIVAGKDSSAIKSSYLQAVTSLTEAINEKYELKSYSFDDGMKVATGFDFSGKETDIAKAFADIENNYANRNIGAIILASDGIYNKGTNPLYSTGKLNAPVYTIALGDTVALKDLWIQSVTHNQVAYLGNSFPVEVVINAVDLGGSEATVSVMREGKTIATEKLAVNANRFSKTVNFVFDADKPGVQKYTVVVSGTGIDKNAQNNTQSFMIDVIDNREKILILAGAPHPDIAALEQSIGQTQTYDVEVSLVNQFTKPLKAYSLVILHQTGLLPPSLAADIKTSSIPVFNIGLTLQNSGRPDQRSNDVEAGFRKEFSLFNVSPALQAYFKDFPAVKCPFRGSLNGRQVNSLLTQKLGVVDTEEPLLYFSDVNGVKSGGFVGDGLWRWRLRDYEDHGNHDLFNELISKTVQYLSVKADKSFFRVYTKKIINENEPLDFTAEVYNQSYELITEPDVSLSLKDSKGKVYNYTFSKKQTMYSLSAGQFAAGEYTWEAKVKTGDKLFTKSGVVVVKELISEKINTVANHQLLYQLSEQSGGTLLYPGQLEMLKKTILETDNIKSITYTQKQLNELVNLKWIFFLILALLSTEWFLRKYNGTV